MSDEAILEAIRACAPDTAPRITGLTRDGDRVLVSFADDPNGGFPRDMSAFVHELAWRREHAVPTD